MSHRSVVLVPADATTDVERATRVAATLAAPRAADIHVLEVTSPYTSSYAREDRRSGGWRLDDTAPARIGHLTFSNVGEGTVRAVRLPGKPELIIPGYARLTAASAIVVDRHYGTSRWWRNADVVTQLGRFSPVPVLVLPSGGLALERIADGEISRIVTAVDFTIGSAVALRTATAVGRRHHARLTLVHALAGFPGPVYSGGEVWSVVQELPRLQQELANRLRHQASPFGYADAATQVGTGHPVTAILDAVTEADADLIVMGVAPRGRLDRWVFGSTLNGVLRRAQIPVLVVPVIGGAEEWSEHSVDEHVVGGPSRSRYAVN